VKLSNIEIKYFRSIKQGSFPVKDTIALVGRNNVGKSSIFRALNAFFNFEKEKHFFENGSHDFSSKSQPKITLTFTDIPEDLKEIFSLEDQLKIQFTYKNSKSKYSYQKAGKFIDLNETNLNKILEKIQFIYIPAVRDYKEALIEDHETLLKQIVEIFLKNHTDKRDVLTPKVKQLEDGFKKVFSKITDEVAKFYFDDKHTTLKIIPKEEIDYLIILKDLKLQVEEKKQGFDLYDCGSGIQSMVNIALYRYLASLKHSNFIVGMEEPENNLHPQLQKKIVNLIKQGKIEKEVQIIFTTHSPYIIDQLENDEIILLRKEKDDKRNFITNAYYFKNNYELEEKSFKKILNSEFLFSNLLIIVDGDADKEVINLLLKKDKIDCNIQDISIIPLNGDGSLRYCYDLLESFKIPKIFVVDKDFFTSYSNDKKDDSRDARGFFKYKNEFKAENEKLIKRIIKSESERKNLLKFFKSNHSKALNLLEKYDFICARYTLEMDLIVPKLVQSTLYQKFKITENNQNTLYLLTEKGKAIKKPKLLMEVCQKLNNSNIPGYLKRVKKCAKSKLTIINK
jgi:predicted ATP-dependent endonuclease of OLD family